MKNPKSRLQQQYGRSERMRAGPVGPASPAVQALSSVRRRPGGVTGAARNQYDVVDHPDPGGQKVLFWGSPVPRSDGRGQARVTAPRRPALRPGPGPARLRVVSPARPDEAGPAADYATGLSLQFLRPTAESVAGSAGAGCRHLSRT